MTSTTHHQYCDRFTRHHIQHEFCTINKPFISFQYIFTRSAVTDYMKDNSQFLIHQIKLIARCYRHTELEIITFMLISSVRNGKKCKPQRICFENLLSMELFLFIAKSSYCIAF